MPGPNPRAHGLPVEVPTQGCGEPTHQRPLPRPPAHLGEGGHGHAVGPLLESAGRLGGEGPGGCAVVGGREGQVFLVQEVARAAALALLQAGGAARTAVSSGPARPPRAPQRRRNERLLSVAWGAATPPQWASPRLGAGCEARRREGSRALRQPLSPSLALAASLLLSRGPEGPGGLTGPPPRPPQLAATPGALRRRPQSTSAPLHPRASNVQPLPRATGHLPLSACSPHVQPVTAVAIQDPGIGEGKPTPPGRADPVRACRGLCVPAWGPTAIRPKSHPFPSLAAPEEGTRVCAPGRPGDPCTHAGCASSSELPCSGRERGWG